MRFPPSIVTEEHPDFALLNSLRGAVERTLGGRDALIGKLATFRRAVDEVIDSPRTGRLLLSETEKTEKTYLGTKVEILLRAELQFPRGSVLDLQIGDVEVDIKNSMGISWMIPQEAIDRPCLLISSDEPSATFSVGLIRCREAYLTPSGNRDRKRQISAAGRCNILWLVERRPYPVNLWERVSAADRTAILSPNGGAERIAALFRT